jgi:endo-1,4-beta-xylanase
MIAEGKMSKSMAPTRRQVLKAMGTLALATRGVPLYSETLGKARWGGVGAAGGAPVALKDVAAQKGIVYGSAVGWGHIQRDPALANLIVQQDSMVTPGTELKWKALLPRPDKFNFDNADALVHWAQSHDLLVHGTALVWIQALPDWFNGYANKGNARDLLVNYIGTVLKHYRGKIHSWDVVNEGIGGGGLRDTPWRRLLGDDYMETAFHAAEEADPSTIRLYNETNMEGDNSDLKRDLVIRLMDKLVSRKVPVQALGIQGHLRYDMGPFNVGKYRKFLGRIADLGLQIFVTELDCRDRDSDITIEQRDRSVAKFYEDYLSTVLEQKAVKVVITWGLADKYSWLTTEAPRRDGQPVRPLLFDQDFNPKPAFEAVRRAFENAPPR